VSNSILENRERRMPSCTRRVVLQTNPERRLSSQVRRALRKVRADTKATFAVRNQQQQDLCAVAGMCLPVQPANNGIKRR